jgi:hypothetical protein
MAALWLAAAATLFAADFPQAQITNGLVKATIYLPDPKLGYYQATRFDWSGQIPHLEYKGHTYFGEWTGRPWNPKLHDTIMGPVEEFSEFDAPGYAAAPVGGTFLKIGVGILRKPQEPKYNHFGVYEIVDNGKWTSRPRPIQSPSPTSSTTRPPAGATNTTRFSASKKASRPSLSNTA